MVCEMLRKDFGLERFPKKGNNFLLRLDTSLRKKTRLIFENKEETIKDRSEKRSLKTFMESFIQVVK